MANLDPVIFRGRATQVYDVLIGADFGALIPIDNRRDYATN